MNSLGLGSERMMAMKDATWDKHANPWSGWSRASVLPLLALAAWSRVWIGWWALVPALAVLLWTWLNPRLFPAPVSINNWMSKGVMGERLWLAQRDGAAPTHHTSILRVLLIVVSLGSAMLLAGLVMLDLTLTMTGLAVAMLGKFWILDRMVWIYAENEAIKTRKAPPKTSQKPPR